MFAAFQELNIESGSCGKLLQSGSCGKI